MSGATDEAKRGDLEEAVMGEMAKVGVEEVSERDLDRARKLLTNAHAFSLETTSGQSSSIGYYYTMTGALDFEWGYGEGIAAVTAGRVREQAEKWLGAEGVSSVVLRPKGSGD